MMTIFLPHIYSLVKYDGGARVKKRRFCREIVLLITSRCASERGLLHEIGKLGVSDRILAVADIFDALSRDRPYRPAVSVEKVLAIPEQGERRETLSPVRGHARRAGVEG